MDEHERGQARQEVEDSVSPWLLWAAWLLVAGGVWWCWYATWREGVPKDSSSVLLDLSADYVLSKWLPAVAALASLAVGVARMMIGGSSLRFLLAATGLVGIKALTLGIEILIRL
jgi:hypothetical protein